MSAVDEPKITKKKVHVIKMNLKKYDTSYIFYVD